VAEVIFVLCALASTLCAVLLLRSYLARRVPLLFWNTRLLHLARPEQPGPLGGQGGVTDVDLGAWRGVSALGVAALVFGLAREES
jgi:hypothetical protein